MFPRIAYWSGQLVSRLSAIVPTACALCGQTGPAIVCAGCRTGYFQTRTARCIRCALPLPGTASGDCAPVCGACLASPPAFDRTITAADYAPPVDQLILSLKFRHQLALASLFADVLLEAVRKNNAGLPDLLTPVPLSPQRLVERGFNQALEIAKPLSRKLDLGLETQLMVRIRHTRAQSQLPLRDRRGNVRQAFIIPGTGSARIRGRHIGLVDDVMTTGETLEAAAATLKRFGAARVTNIVVARTA